MMKLNTPANKRLLLGAGIIALAFVLLPSWLESMLAPMVGQYIGQYTGFLAAFLLAIPVLWLVKRTEKHV
jgi:hypothetical protein